MRTSLSNRIVTMIRGAAVLLLAASTTVWAQTAPLKCDVNLDGVIDLTDVNLIIAARNTLATVPSDPRDADGNGVINVLDARTCQQRCTFAACKRPPKANAGPDQSVFVGDTAVLNGAGSTDPDGLPLTYHWSLVSVPAGSAATLTGPNSVSPTFGVDKAGTYKARLIVNDGVVDSLPSTVLVTTLNSAPVANPKASCATLPNTDCSIPIGSLVGLDGSASTDVDGNALTYAWSLVGTPASSTATIATPTSVNASFTSDAPGDFTVKLIVNDGTVDSAPKTIKVTSTNVKPTAVATANPVSIPSIPRVVQLDGSGSTDSEHQTLSFSWSLLHKPATSSATLSSTTASNPQFTADALGAYVAQLIVNDGFLSSDPVTVTASTNNQPPVAVAGDPQNVALGATVQLSGAGSSDPEGASLGYFWSFTTKPVGSVADFNNANAQNPTFAPDLAGIYVAQLIVNDGALDSAPATVQINVTPPAQADIGVTKTVNNATPTVGTQVTFTVTATNTGPSAATGVQVTDLLPVGYTFGSATPSQGSYVSGTGVWTVGNLALNGSATLQITATVLASGPYNNTATKTASTPADPNTVNDAATANVVPVGQADIGVTKTVNNATPTVGTQVTFTVTATNTGPSAATGVQVTDLLPVGYTFGSATPSQGSYVSGTGVWTVGNLALNGSATLQITATVLASGPYNNTATKTASTPADPNTVNDAATANVVPVGQADIGVTKTVNNATPTVGTQVTFTVTATNTGPSAATGVQVTDLLPVGYTFGSATPSQGSYVSGTGVWTVGNLALNGSATLQITATVLASGPYNNTATKTASTPADPNTVNDAATANVVPVGQADIGVTKTVNNATPTVGTQVTFTVTATNTGPSAATGVQVTDLLPVGYTFGSATPSQGSYVSGTGVWTVGNLALNGSATLQITATVLASGPYNNTATKTASTPADPNTVNDAATANVVPVGQADIGVTKTVNNATPTVGTQVTFTVTATNTGPSAATGVQVTDLLPVGYTFGSATPSQGSYVSGTGVWTVGNLALNGSATLQITATVLASGPYNNTATKTASTPADPVVANDSSTVVVTPQASADIRIVKSVDNATPTIGQNVTFTLLATNLGPGVAQGVVVQDLLPTGYTFVQKGVFNGSYDETTGVWTVGTLSLNQQAQLNITATVKASGSYNNTAARTASTPADPVVANDSSTVVVTPFTTADVRVVKSVDNATPTIGQNVTFTLLATNLGPGVAQGVVVQDLLPTGYTFVQKGVFNGSYDETTGVWTVGTLSLNQQAQLNITATVKASGSYNNTAARTASTPADPVAANDSSTVVVTPHDGGRAGGEVGGQCHADDRAERDLYVAGDQPGAGSGTGGGGAGPAADRLHVRAEGRVQR